MQNQERERKKLAPQISTKTRRGAMCSSRRKPDKGDVIFTAEFYVEQEKEKKDTERQSSNGSFQGLRNAKNKGRGKLRHDGVATCYQKRGKLDRKKAEGGKRQFRGPLQLRNRRDAIPNLQKKQKSEKRQVCSPCTKSRRAKPMAGTLEQNTNTTTRKVAQTNTGQDEKPTKRTKLFLKKWKKN